MCLFFSALSVTSKKKYIIPCDHNFLDEFSYPNLMMDIESASILFPMPEDHVRFSKKYANDTMESLLLPICE
jgi:hypothetical protein